MRGNAHICTFFVEISSRFVIPLMVLHKTHIYCNYCIIFMLESQENYCEYELSLHDIFVSFMTKYVHFYSFDLGEEQKKTNLITHETYFG